MSRAEGKEEVAPFWQEHSLSLPYSAQSEDHIFRLFADHTVPRIYIANPYGIVVATFDDTNMPTAETLAKTTGAIGITRRTCSEFCEKLIVDVYELSLLDYI